MKVIPQFQCNRMVEITSESKRNIVTIISCLCQRIKNILKYVQDFPRFQQQRKNISSTQSIFVSAKNQRTICSQFPQLNLVLLLCCVCYIALIFMLLLQLFIAPTLLKVELILLLHSTFELRSSQQRCFHACTIDL